MPKLRQLADRGKGCPLTVQGIDLGVKCIPSKMA